MELLRHLKEARIERKYRTALTIYLAVYTYTKLPVADQDRISAWVKMLIDGKFNPAFSFKEYELFLPVYAKAAFWAVAMKSLQISPAVPGEEWQFPSQPRWLNRFYVVNKLLRNWRSFNQTTAKVESYLRSKGVDVGTMDLRSTRLVRQASA